MLSVFDIFKVGIGPSSSHTVGPMNAARRFVELLGERGVLDRVVHVTVHLYGSLALTGKGHGTDRAVLLGLEGQRSDLVVPQQVEPTLERIRSQNRLRLNGSHEIYFDEARAVQYHRSETLAAHSNGMRFVAERTDEVVLAIEEFYSVGGGFIVRAGEGEAGVASAQTCAVAQPFTTAEEWLQLARRNELELFEVVMANERLWREEAEIREGLLRIWRVMQQCVVRGFQTHGVLPGGLKVRRRAPGLYRTLIAETQAGAANTMEWVSAFALAVNEENAAGGRVVTAPTNGAAGIIPAVLHYYMRFEPGADDNGIVRFLLVAGAIAMLYKRNASLSAAEMGCQGEVGVACSMAAAGLVAALHGASEQIENAAEIGMEHHLGLTCDPVGGLVQIPCIERNAIGAAQAIVAARLALRGDGSHGVSLDQVISTMRETGHDMSSRYKETSLGGLAVNVPQC